MSTWIRRDYEGVGVTQAPPGRYLERLQEPYLGKVLLCIDVSGSMASLDGERRNRLQRATAGAERFVAEAVRAHYEVGLILWNHGVAGSVPLARDPGKLLRALRSARIQGGNNIVPTLRLGIQLLGQLTGDRVMAIFGDGDIGPVEAAAKVARQASETGIRIVVRGLGDQATRELNLIATDPDEQGAVGRRSADIEQGIASMITSVVGGLGRRRR